MRGQVNTVNEAKLRSTIGSTFEVLVVWRAVDVVMEKNWAQSVDQCWLQALQFLVHHIDLLSMLLKCNGFAGIQQGVVNQTRSRPPNSDRDFFWGGASLALENALELLLGPSTELVITSCHIKSTFHRSSQSNQEMILCCCVRVIEDNTSKQRFFWFAVSSWNTHLPRVLFHLSNLLQMLNNDRMFDIEFFGNFSCSYKRIGFNDALSWLLSTSDDWPLHSSSSSLSSPLQNFLKHHCTVCLLAVPGPMCCWCWELCLLLYDRFWTQIRKSQCRGPRFNPWSGNLIPNATTKDFLCHNKDPGQPNKYVFFNPTLQIYMCWVFTMIQAQI